MKLTVLIENTTLRQDLACEHGLSLYLETPGCNILFDAGQSEAFAENAEKLDIDLRKADLAVLSHGHYDHGGGLRRFLELNDHAPVYLNRHAFGQHEDGSGRYIGLDSALRDSGRLRYADEFLEIAPGLELHACNERERVQDIDSAGLLRREGECFLPEDFRHEQYLLLREGDQRILISGCSHKGIVNIASWFRADVLFGGFHFMNVPVQEEGAARLDAAAQALLSLPTRYVTGHCTGQEQYEFLKARMGSRLEYMATGAVFELPV